MAMTELARIIRSAADYDERPVRVSAIAVWAIEWLVRLRAWPHLAALGHRIDMELAKRPAR